MFVIQLLLPLTTSDGGRRPQEQFAEVRTTLTARFGGVTAYSRAPAEGLWVTNDTGVSRDDVIVVEVMPKNWTGRGGRSTGRNWSGSSSRRRS